MPRIFSLLFFAVIALPYFARGFCVYNRYSDTTSFFIRQIAGEGPNARTTSRFRKWNVTPDQTECCSYQNQDCAANGNPNDIVRFWIVVKTDKGYGAGNFEIDCPAGGSVVLSGTADHPNVEVHWADGRLYQHTIQRNANTHWDFADLKATRIMKHIKDKWGFK